MSIVKRGLCLAIAWIPCLAFAQGPDGSGACRADGRTVYSDTMQLNSTAQKQVPLDQVISAVPPR